jgi:hypothetical protein
MATRHDDIGIMGCSRCFERQNTPGKILGEHGCGRRGQRRSPSSLGKGAKRRCPALYASNRRVGLSQLSAKFLKCRVEFLDLVRFRGLVGWRPVMADADYARPF